MLLTKREGRTRNWKEFGNEVVREQKWPISHYDPEQTLQTLLGNNRFIAGVQKRKKGK